MTLLKYPTLSLLLSLLGYLPQEALKSPKSERLHFLSCFLVSLIYYFFLLTFFLRISSDLEPLLLSHYRRRSCGRLEQVDWLETNDWSAKGAASE